MRLKQVHTIADRASWTEYFYDGELKVVNGETETDNPIWIEHLVSIRGFKPVDEVPENITHFGKLSTDEAVEPLGTQVAQETETESEREHVQELIEERPPVDQETTETVEEDSTKEPVPFDEDEKEEEPAKPSDLEHMMNKAMGKKALTRRRR